jgi:hypothetical protein
MAKKPPGKSSEKDLSRRKRPSTTIDLSATEVHVEPKEDASSDNPPAESAEAAAADGAPHEELPAVIEPVPQARFYEQPIEGETVEPREFRATADEPAYTRESLRAEPSPPPRWFPWAVASAAACGGALVLFLALFLAGVLQLPNQVQPRQDSDSGEQNARLAKLEAALANRPPPVTPAADSALASRVGALEVAIKSIGDNTSNAAGRSGEAADTAREARERSEANAKRLAELSAAIDRLGSNTVAKSDLEKVQDRVSAVESSTRTVEQKLETPGSTAADRDVRIAVLASSLKATVERGSPFATELNAIKPLLKDQKAAAALEPFAAKGLPPASAMIAEFAALMPALNDAAAPSSHTGGILDRLQAGASRLVRVRPVNEAPGTDPASIIDRAEAKSLRGDIPGIVKELSSLPPNVRAPADAWIAKANARAAALAAVQQISADALNALAKPAQ